MERYTGFWKASPSISLQKRAVSSCGVICAKPQKSRCPSRKWKVFLGWEIFSNRFPASTALSILASAMPTLIIRDHTGLLSACTL